MPPNATFLREDAERTARHAALTEGLSGYQLKVVEQLMDNAEQSLAEETSTANVAVFTRSVKPLIRRIFPALVANQLVSIQPMVMPTQKVFFMDYTYDSPRGLITAGTRLDYEAQRTETALKQQARRVYAGGIVKGETVGTGTGARTTFNLALYPIRAGSLTVRVASSVVTNYTIDEATGAIVFTAAPANAATIDADYALIMEGLGSAGNAQIPEIGLTESMKLKTRWTLEGQQDLKAYFGMDMEDELTKQLGEELRREIDRLIINDLVDNAAAANLTWSKAVPASTKRSEHYETLIHAIGDISNEMFKKRMVNANFIVVSPDTVNMLDKTNTFRLTSGGAPGIGGTATISAGPNVLGTLANRYNVIVDPLFQANKVLVGYKGSEWNETGYVYAPYVAVSTDTWMDPNTMKPVKGLMSRFGRHLVNGDYYGTIDITA
jgi:hypothetical protein